MEKKTNIFKSLFAMLLIIGVSLVIVSCGKAKKFKVEFANSNLETIEVDEGKTIDRPNKPEKTGFEFDDWYKDSEFTELFDFNETKITKDTTIYALFYVNIDNALLIGAGLEHNQTSYEHYYVKGKILSISQPTYGNMWITDGTNQISIYGVYGAEGELFEALPERPEVGDIIYVKGPLKKFGEDVEFNKVTLVKFHKEDDQGPTEYVDTTIAGALEAGAKLAHTEISKTHYRIEGKIDSITNLVHGNMWLTDGTNRIFVYGVSGENGELFQDLPERPIVGDIIYISGPLKKFDESVEMNQATMISFHEDENEEPFDPTGYEEMSIVDARSKEVDDKVLVEGIVLNRTYATSMAPNGVYIADEHGSIYIFSDRVAASVEVGDLVKIAGQRANYIAANEATFAEQHGYQGAIQIDRAYIVENVSSNNTPDFSWVPEMTVKELMDVDPTVENITTTIVKVNAYINKVLGTGYTNYYFDDIDQTTGSYAYTMNNGKDFSWLDEYDGQFREVYLSVINAKSSSAGIQYRLVPIKIGEIAQYDQSYNAEYAIKYHVMNQFNVVEYLEGGSPDLEMITSISAEWLNIVGVTITYVSSNTNSVYFEEENGKLVLKTNNTGAATITVTAKDEHSEYTEQVVVTVIEAPHYDTVDINDVFSMENGTEVILKGVVSASLLNQKGGFFLIDDTGVIAVRIDAAVLDTLKLGQLIIIQGKIAHNGTKEDAIGQLYLGDAKVLLNYQGNHSYSTASFITENQPTLQEIMDTSKLDQLYIPTWVMTFKIVKTDGSYPKIRLADPTNDEIYLNLYSNSFTELAFIEPYVGQTIEVEFKVVNWNGKQWQGAVISIIVDGVKIPSDSNFK